MSVKLLPLRKPLGDAISQLYCYYTAPRSRDNFVIQHIIIDCIKSTTVRPLPSYGAQMSFSVVLVNFCEPVDVKSIVILYPLWFESVLNDAS